MANKYRRHRYAKLLEAKLKKLSETLRASLSSPNFYTKEQYIAESVRVLTTFYKDLDGPITSEEDYPLAASLPDADQFNAMLQNIKDNLDITFTEFENLEDLILANFNFAVTGHNRLNARLKKIYSLAGDYAIYADYDDDIVVVKDSFSNTDKLEIGSSLLNSDECYVNEGEGIVCLPIDTSKESTILVHNSPRIDPSSNGVAGNNYQLGADWNGDVRAIIDDNADTWFEYERTCRLSKDPGDPLMLDITVVLTEPKIANYIRVNPNNFGTRTSVFIEKIETSLDGDSYLSIKDDIPVAGYLQEDEENIFTLAPSTSKYKGQGLYTFTPRKIKYVHFVFSQPDPYVIETANGQRLRYAIGIKDVELKALTFLNAGEIVGANQNVGREIEKVGLQASQDPILPSSIASIEHFVSTDNGASWNQIQPQAELGVSGQVSEVPEILNFNNADTNSIVTPYTPTTIRWKAVLKRNDGAFKEGGAALSEKIAVASEIHGVADTTPHTITLENVPLENTIQVIDPMYGCRGDARNTYVIRSGEEQGLYPLPDWGDINSKRPWKKESIGDGMYGTVKSDDSDWINVHVGGKAWDCVTDDISTYGSTDKVYQIDWNDNILHFGDDTHGDLPPANSKITMFLEPERLMPVGGENSIVPLVFPTGSDKKQIVIERYGARRSGTSSIPRGETVLNLQHDHIDSLITDVLPVLSTDEQTFINGRDELSSSGDWSLDVERGIIYLYEPSDTFTEVEYYYYPVYTLSESDWEWTSSTALNDGIKIKPSGWQTNSATFTIAAMPSPISSGFSYCLHLPNLSIIRKTLQISATVSGDDPFVEEVPYIDGRVELKEIPSDTGLYSVDYEGGRIFVQRALSNITAITVQYEYADYRMQYPIARLIDPSSYKIDYDNKKITLDSSVILGGYNIPRGEHGGYLVSYSYVLKSRADLPVLKNYFSPVLKDYALRILPRE